MRADRLEPLPDGVLDRWSTFGHWPERSFFRSLLGLDVQERQADVVAEGWVTRRGRSTVSRRAEATSDGRLVMEGSLLCALRHPG